MNNVYNLEEKMTLAQAAEMAEMDLHEFMKYPGSPGIPCINYPAEDLFKEMELLDDYMQ